MQSLLIEKLMEKYQLSKVGVVYGKSNYEGEFSHICSGGSTGPGSVSYRPLRPGDPEYLSDEDHASFAKNVEIKDPETAREWAIGYLEKFSELPFSPENTWGYGCQPTVEHWYGDLSIVVWRNRTVEESSPITDDELFRLVVQNKIPRIE